MSDPITQSPKPPAQFASPGLTPSERHLLAQTPGAKRAKRRMRFSLRTLVLLVLLIGACALIWQRGFASWVESQRIMIEGEAITRGHTYWSNLAWSSDGKRIAAFLEFRGLVCFDLEARKVLWQQDPQTMKCIQGIRFEEGDRAIGLLTSDSFKVDCSEPLDPVHAMELRFDAETGAALSSRQEAWIEDDIVDATLSRSTERQQFISGIISLTRMNWAAEAALAAQARDLRFQAILYYDYDPGWCAMVVPKVTDPWEVEVLWYRYVTAKINFPEKEDRDLRLYAARFAPDNRTLALLGNNQIIIYTFRWPPEWWGQFCRPEIWLVLVLFVSFVISWRQDQRLVREKVVGAV